jgi:hypothetical protein
MKKLAVISTKNPTIKLLETITNVQIYYPEFDIVVIDSDSTETDYFSKVPKEVTICLTKNKNYELGAWIYAYNTFNTYDIYMCIQDTYMPIKRMLNIDYIQSCDLCLHTSQGLRNLNSIDHYLLKRFHDVYNGSSLYKEMCFAKDTTPCSFHTSLITTNSTMKDILQLEQIYIDRFIKKEKVDSLLSEITIGWLGLKRNKRIISMNAYFHKVHGNRN